MMRILALIPGGIDDQILFFPTLDDLKRQYPQAQVDVVVEPRAKGAYRLSQTVDRVLTFNFQGRNGPADWGNLIGLIREREYDLALSSTENWTFSGFILWLAGVSKRIGYAGPFLLTDPVPLVPNQYAAVTYHDLLQGLAIRTTCPEIEIKVPKKDLEWVEAEQQRLQLSSEKGYVLIYGGNGVWSRGQSYPVSNWQAIVQDFQQRQPDLPIALLQGPNDRDWTRSILEVCPTLKVISLEDVGKLAAIVAGANLLLCTDSVPMQLAVAVKTYLVALLAGTAKRLPTSDRFIGLTSPTQAIADISPVEVLKKVWGE